MSGVVLAGGQSTRMGRDKALLEYQGRTLIHRQVEILLQAGCGEIFISGRAGVDYQIDGIKVLLDTIPGLGPLAGISMALHAIAGSHLMVVPVDLPRLLPRQLGLLQAACDDDVGAVFAGGGGLEPLVAIYPAQLKGAAAMAVAAGKLSVQAFCRTAIQAGLLRVVDVPAEERYALLNWNEPGDFPDTE